MSLQSFEARAHISAPQSEVFEFLDDHQRLVSHMSKSSWSMGGGRMVLESDATQGRTVGSRLRLSGRAFGIKLAVEEEITERIPPRRKVWRTVGEPRLLVVGQYKLGFELLGAGDGTVVRIFIDYELPAGVLRVAGLAFAGMYARWCVNRMIGDVRAHFAERVSESAKAA